MSHWCPLVKQYRLETIKEKNKVHKQRKQSDNENDCALFRKKLATKQQMYYIRQNQTITWQCDLDDKNHDFLIFQKTTIPFYLIYVLLFLKTYFFSSVNSSKANGPDIISLIKESKPLSQYYLRLLSNSYFRRSWKLANVIQFTKCLTHLNLPTIDLFLFSVTSAILWNAVFTNTYTYTIMSPSILFLHLFSLALWKVIQL